MRQLSLNLEPTVSRVERSQFNYFFSECEHGSGRSATLVQV